VTTIEEIKEQIRLDGGYPDYNEYVNECMRHYAVIYAIKCLQIASESVKTEQVMNIQQGYEPFAETRINKGSILNIKLPPHD
jgi:hypothetical protein